MSVFTSNSRPLPVAAILRAAALTIALPAVVAGCSATEATLEALVDSVASPSSSSLYTASGEYAGAAAAPQAALTWTVQKDGLGSAIGSYAIYRLASASACPTTASSITSAGTRLQALSAVSGATGSYSDTSVDTTQYNCYALVPNGLTGEDVAAAYTVSVSPAPLLAISDGTTYNYGSIAVGATGTKTFTITNSGGSSAALATISTSTVGLAAPLTVTGGTCTTATAIAPAASCTLTVAFAPTAVGSSAATIAFAYKTGSLTLTTSRALAATGISPSALAFTPATHGFGNVTVGATASQAFTLSNPSATNATSVYIAASGAGFALVSNNCGTSGTPISLAASATCTFSVQLTPAGGGAISGSVNLSYYDGSSTQTGSVPLTATGLTPALLAFSPTSKAYTSTTVGASSATQTFTITNSGQTSAANTYVSLGTAQFTLATGAGNTCGVVGTKVTVAGSSSCTVDVTFAPSSSGAKTDNLTVTYDNGVATAQTQTAALSGTGLTPASLAFSPTSKAYTSTTVGASSATQTFTITNSGQTSAANTYVSLGTAQFTLATGAGNTCGVVGTKVTVAGSSSCTVDVTFTPSSSGAQADSLTITYDNGVASAQTQTASLTGTGLTPASLAISDATTYDYLTQALSSNTDKSFTVTNSGQSAATLGTVSTAGLGLSGAFSFLAGGTCATSGSVAASGGTCTLTVRFTPTASGATSGVITLAYNDGAAAQNATRPVQGTGNTPPALSLPANRVYPLDGASLPLLQDQSSAYTFTPTTLSDVDSHTITLSCTYSTVGMSATDVNYAAAGTACTALPSLATTSGVTTVSTAGFSTSTGVLTWWPTRTQRGTYKVTITATDTQSGSTAQDLYLTVRENHSISNLRMALQANAAWDSVLSGKPSTPKAPTAGLNNNTDAWLGLFGSLNGALSGTVTTASPWSGTAASGSTAYALALNGSSDRVDLGSSALSGQTRMLASTWVKLSDVTSTGKGAVVLSSGGNLGNGFALRQSDNENGKVELDIGSTTYQAMIAADAPVSYWRLTESSGTSAADSIGSNTGTYTAGYTLAASGPLQGNSDTGVTLNGTTGKVALGSVTVGVMSSFEAWVQTTSSGAARPVFSNRPSGGATGQWWGITSGGALYESNVTGGATGTAVVNDGQWHHIAYTSNGVSTTLYVDGVQDGAATAHSISSSTAAGAIGWDLGTGTDYFPGSISQAALYDYVLSPQQVLNHFKAGKSRIFPQDRIMSLGPVHYWKFNEKGGTTVTNIAAGGINATLSGTAGTGHKLGMPGARSDSSDTSLQLDGSTGYATLASTHSAIAGTGVTFAGWAYMDTLPSNGSVKSLFYVSGANGAAQNVAIYTVNATDVRPIYYSYYGGSNQNFNAASDTGIRAGSWYHYAVSQNYTTRTTTIYLNGVVTISGATGVLTVPTTPTTTLGTGTAAFGGRIDDFAIFNRPLTTAQVLSIYQSSNIWKCQSTSTLGSGEWNLLSAIYDGTVAKLFVNGRQECSVTPGTTFTPSSNLTLGATSTGAQFLNGSVADVRVYGTSDGSAVATATDVKTEFDVTANKFRVSAIPHVATSGLVLHLDAASGKNGVTPYSSGCATTDLSWFDLSSTANDARLFNFGTCGTYGWVGTGTTGSPYALNFDGTSGSDYAEVPDNAAYDFTNAFTAELWFYPTTLGDRDLIGKFDHGVATEWAFNMCNTGGLCPSVASTSTSTGFGYSYSANNVITANAWNHAVMVYDGAQGTAANRVIAYVNGTALTFSGSSSLPATMQNTTAPIRIGDRKSQASYNMAGKMAIVRLYNRKLTAQEISQNCKAQQARFGISSCN